MSGGVSVRPGAARAPWAAVLAVLAGAAAAPAQTPSRLRVSGPEPGVVVYPQHAQVLLRIDAGDNVDARRLTPPRLPEVAGLTLTLQGPSTRQHMYSDGFRMTRQTLIDWTIDIAPQRVGDYTIPSFAVPVGTGSESTQPLNLRVVQDIEGGKFGYLDVRVVPERVYVHEPIRVRFELGVDASLRVSEHQARTGEPYIGITVSAPWLAALDGAVPIDAPPPDRSRVVAIVHDTGRKQFLLPVEMADTVERDGRRFQVYRFERSFLPSRVGKLAIPSTVMGFEAFTGETRIVQDFFAPRREPVVKTYYVDTPGTEVDVVPLPEEGRPSPFSGAVGRFTIAARVDRERVRVGSSVKLIVTIRGEGNTEFFTVPELPREMAGFHTLGSKEKRERGTVEVTYDLTPLSPDVKQTPAVAWSYFDTTPGAERYVEVKTTPVAITVEALPPGEGLAALPGDAAKPVVPGVDDIFDMKPLAAGEPAIAAPAPGRGVLAALLGAPWVVAALAAIAWRACARSRADVRGRRERGAQRTFARALAAGTPPAAALVAYLADRLALAEAAIIAPDLGDRLRAAGVADALAEDVARAVDAGVASRYGGGSAVDRAQAERLVAALNDVVLRPRPTDVVARAVVVVAILAAGAVAQDAFARGEAAYRAGDYAAAAAAFAEAARTPSDDRRADYNLGNALYRQGDLGRALAAYERARLGMPRDEQLAANLALVRRKLDLASGEGEPFLDALAGLRDAFTAREQVALAVALHALAAGLLVLGWRRPVLRLLGALAALPAALLAVELVLLAPQRPHPGIVVAPRAEVVAEPRSGLDAVVKLRRGARVAVVGEGPSWTKVRVGSREGYVPADAVETVR